MTTAVMFLLISPLALLGVSLVLPRREEGDD